MKKGLFITFEGIDGSGKTTQLDKTAEYLKKQGFDVILTREPGALDTGKAIRSILLSAESAVSDRCEMFLFLADRANHAEMLIEPALKSGRIVLCDRYIDSTIAYQGYGRGQDIELLKMLNNIAAGRTIPDLTLIYDIDAENASKRIVKSRRQDRMEKAGLEFQKKVRSGYLELQQQNPDRMKIINAGKSEEKVFEDTKAQIETLMHKMQNK